MLHLKCGKCGNEEGFYTKDYTTYNNLGDETGFDKGDCYQCSECDEYVDPEETNCVVIEI
jgi:hypothetical protein